MGQSGQHRNNTMKTNRTIVIRTQIRTARSTPEQLRLNPNNFSHMKHIRANRTTTNQHDQANRNTQNTSKQTATSGIKSDDDRLNKNKQNISENTKTHEHKSEQK